MKRYHIKVFTKAQHQDKLISFTYKLNNMQWKYTSHCLDNLKLRALDLKQLLYWIKTELRLDYNDIFEFYTDDFDNIIKVCYRIPYNKTIDVILVIGHNKQIITLYYNSKNDKHYTLRKEIYVNV